MIVAVVVVVVLFFGPAGARRRQSCKRFVRSFLAGASLACQRLNEGKNEFLNALGGVGYKQGVGGAVVIFCDG